MLLLKPILTTIIYFGLFLILNNLNTYYNLGLKEKDLEFYFIKSKML